MSAKPPAPLPTTRELTWPVIETLRALGGSASTREIYDNLAASGRYSRDQLLVTHAFGPLSEIAYPTRWAQTLVKAAGTRHESAGIVVAHREWTHCYRKWSSRFDSPQVRSHAEESPRHVSQTTYVPWASSPAVRRVMQGNRHRDTRPEVAVRRAAHRLGLRYYVSRRPEPTIKRRADMVFPRERIAVFIDGCFWHGCPLHASVPSTNEAYWRGKIGGNRDRDVATTQALQEMGWRVVRFWEHESPRDAANALRDAVDETRRSTVGAMQPQREPRTDHELSGASLAR